MIDIESRIERIPESGCWIWLKTVDRDGYGKYGGSGPERNEMVHRLSYELYKGPIPEGHHVDHLCYVRACANPYHLEAVTPLKNMQRMRAHNGSRGLVQFCKQGHAFDLANTKVRKDGKRECIACRKVYDDKRNADRRQKRLKNSQQVG